ncbi:MAG TPA: hypothetical protein VK874_09550 [Gaiellaceae bacterium]|nr:hypothetical protein [Gaiellaceae bacterium]
MRILLAAAAVLALATPAVAHADDDEARQRARCAGGTAELRVEADDGRLEVELRVDAARRAGTVRVVLLHERVLVHRGTGRAGRYRLHRAIPDWQGRETVTARIATTRRGTCTLSVTV